MINKRANDEVETRSILSVEQQYIILIETIPQEM